MDMDLDRYEEVAAPSYSTPEVSNEEVEQEESSNPTTDSVAKEQPEEPAYKRNSPPDKVPYDRFKESIEAKNKYKSEAEQLRKELEELRNSKASSKPTTSISDDDDDDNDILPPQPSDYDNGDDYDKARRKYFKSIASREAARESRRQYEAIENERATARQNAEVRESYANKIKEAAANDPDYIQADAYLGEFCSQNAQYINRDMLKRVINDPDAAHLVKYLASSEDRMIKMAQDPWGTYEDLILYKHSLRSSQETTSRVSTEEKRASIPKSVRGSSRTGIDENSSVNDFKKFFR